MSTPDPEQAVPDEERDAIAPAVPDPDDPEATQPLDAERLAAERGSAPNLHGSGPQPPDEEQS